MSKCMDVCLSSDFSSSYSICFSLMIIEFKFLCLSIFFNSRISYYCFYISNFYFYISNFILYSSSIFIFSSSLAFSICSLSKSVAVTFQLSFVISLLSHFSSSSILRLNWFLLAFERNF